MLSSCISALEEIGQADPGRNNTGARGQSVSRTRQQLLLDRSCQPKPPGGMAFGHSDPARFHGQHNIAAWNAPFLASLEDMRTRLPMEVAVSSSINGSGSGLQLKALILAVCMNCVTDLWLESLCWQR